MSRRLRNQPQHTLGFFRILRGQTVGDPRALLFESVSRLVVLVGWYDREVAAALFEPVRKQIEQTDERSLANNALPFTSWSIFDPRAAAAKLEQVSVAAELEGANASRERVAEILGLSYEDRFRLIWSGFTEMTGLFERDRQ